MTHPAQRTNPARRPSVGTALEYDADEITDRQLDGVSGGMPVNGITDKPSGYGLVGHYRGCPLYGIMDKPNG